MPSGSLIFVEIGRAACEAAHHGFLWLHGMHSGNWTTATAQGLDLLGRLTASNQLALGVETGEEGHRTFSRYSRYRHATQNAQVLMRPRTQFAANGSQYFVELTSSDTKLLPDLIQQLLQSLSHHR